jgi:3-hydroxyphenylacetate 6-hydroxylase
MCAGSLLANRELYLTSVRLINCFRIEKYDDDDCHPVRGNMDPTSLVAMPHRYKARFIPRNEAVLRKDIEGFVPVE